MTADGSVTHELARFVAETPSSAMPGEARARALDAIADVIAVTVAGSRSSIGQVIRGYAATGGGPASLIPGSQRAPAELAALANGTAAHALDFDDTSHPGHTHPSAVLFPAVLAVAQQSGATGQRMVSGYLVGFELQAALGRALNIGHYRAGWHATSTFGSLAAAAAASHVLGSSTAQTSHALGIAASSAAGLIANFGTMTKPLHAGQAAAAGVRAGLLAAGGWTARPRMLDRDHGFFSLFRGDGEPAPDAATGELGERWTILEPFGLAIKAYPTCGATHPALDATDDLRQRTAGRSVRHVHVGTSSLLPTVLTERDPQTAEAARFSLEYTVAMMLVRGRMTLAELTPESLADASVRSAMRMISQSVDDRVAMSREYAAVVRFEMEDGTIEESLVEVARGKNANPISEAAARAKFDGCVGAGADRLWEGVHSLDIDEPPLLLESALVELRA